MQKRILYEKVTCFMHIKIIKNGVHMQKLRPFKENEKLVG